MNRYLKYTSEEKGKYKVSQSNSGDTEGFIALVEKSPYNPIKIELTAPVLVRMGWDSNA